LIFKLYCFLFVFIIFNAFCAVHDEPSLGKPSLPIAATAEPSKEDLSKLVYESRIIPFEELRASLPLSMHLHSLTLLNCGLRTPEVQLVSSFLQEAPSLTELSLPYNFIEGEGANALEIALTQNTSLKRLDVSYNRVHSDDLLKAVGVALNRRSTFLDFLNLGNNSFTRIDQTDLERLFSTRIGFLDLILSNISLTSIGNALNSQKGKGALAGLQIPESDENLSEIYEVARAYNVILYVHKGFWIVQPRREGLKVLSFISQQGPNPLSLVAPEPIVSVASAEDPAPVVLLPTLPVVDQGSPKSTKSSPRSLRFSLKALFKKP